MLFKVLERPIGTFTGTVPVSFPLYTLRTGPLSLDFSLEYNNTGGVRVEEAAGNIGLGFSVPGAANKITRIMRGLPDDGGYGRLNNSRKPGNFDCSDMNVVSAYSNYNQIDLQPDIFMYNINGETGSFFFAEDKTVIMMQNAPFEINPIFNTDKTIKGWRIFAQNGIQYFLGQNADSTVTVVDRTSITYENDTHTLIPGASYISGWPLQEIWDMNFQYRIKLTYEYSPTVIKTISGAFLPLQKISANCNGFNLSVDQAFVTNNNYEYVLSKAEAGTGPNPEIVYFNNLKKIDAEGGTYLDNIDIIGPLAKWIRTYRFTYDYFNPGGGPYTQRLKLTGFKQFSAAAISDSLEYKFEYSPVSLPARLSSEVDYWGFANGKIGNKYFIPNISYTFQGSTVNVTAFSDRSVSAYNAEAGVLNKIIYPTGGYRKFIYEGNQALTRIDDQVYPDNAAAPQINLPSGNWIKKNRAVGGIRIKEIQDFDPVTGKTSSTKYQYKLFDIDSNVTSGMLVSPVRIINIENVGVDCSYMKLYPSSCYPLATAGGSFVCYAQVRTIENGNGWVDRKYSFMQDQLPTSLEYPIVPPADLSYQRGQLLEEKYYNENGTLLRKKSWNYGFTTIAGSERAWVVKAYYKTPGSGMYREYPKPETPWEPPVKALCKPFNTTGQFMLPLSESDSVFTSSGNLGQKTSYTYYPPDSAMSWNSWRPLAKTTTNLHDGTIRSRTYRYCFSRTFVFQLSSRQYDLMVYLLINRYRQPIEEVDSLKDNNLQQLISGTKYLFDLRYQDTLELRRIREYTSLKDSTETNLTYDTSGNIIEKYQTKGIKVTYLWGYNYYFPVAKVIGADYSTVAALVNTSIVQSITVTDLAMRTELNKIRTALKGKALVTTYTYNRFGITSETDPAGQTITYEYDDFGRLKVRKDMDGKILQLYDYRYQKHYTE